MFVGIGLVLLSAIFIAMNTLRQRFRNLIKDAAANLQQQLPFQKIASWITGQYQRSDVGIQSVALGWQGVSPFDFGEVLVMDGIQHPSDTAGKSRIAGVLRYVPTLE